MTRRVLVLSIMLITVMALPFVSSVGAVSEPDVVVTSVYWGTNPLGGISVHPGDTNIPLSIVLSNAGDAAARDVSATLVLASPFSYAYNANGSQMNAGTVDQSAGDIQSGYSFTVRYALTVASDAVAGIHRLTLILDYKTARELLAVEKTLTVDVPVWTGDVRVQNVVTVPGKVYPGDNQINVKAWLVNSGTGSTADFQVRLVLQDPFQASSGGSDTFFLGTMQPGQVSEADFYVDISKSAQFGSYNLKLVTVSAGSNGQVEIGQIPLYVSEKVVFEVVQVEPTVVHAGDSGVSIQITIKNTGTVEADSVRAQLMVGNDFSGTLTDFLGTMQPGESKTAFLTVDVDSKATSQVYKMDLRLDWTQSDNSLDNTLPIELQVAPAELPLPLIAVAVVLLALVVVVVVRRRRKAQEQKPKT
ncbi:MAG: hypothetical protein ABSG74_04300 [Candidatus Bathyarchaeia archaeon]